jgi:hypothetical protein
LLLPLSDELNENVFIVIFKTFRRAFQGISINKKNNTPRKECTCMTYRPTKCNKYVLCKWLICTERDTESSTPKNSKRQSTHFFFVFVLPPSCINATLNMWYVRVSHKPCGITYVNFWTMHPRPSLLWLWYCDFCNILGVGALRLGVTRINVVTI